jgi:hypothetical protein
VKHLSSRLARDKHSSLFCPDVRVSKQKDSNHSSLFCLVLRDEDEKFYDVTRFMTSHVL